MIPGTPVQMSGEEWIIPPLTMRQMQAHAPELEIVKTMSGLDPAAITATATLVLAAMLRNYPEMTAEKLLDMLDMGNLGTALLATVQRPTTGGTPATSAAPHGSPRPALSVVANGSQ